MDYDGEYKWIKNDYWPWLNKKVEDGNYTTFFDSGHHNLYFADGLMRYISQSDLADKSIFIRMRRHRIEAAISLTIGHFSKNARSVDPAERARWSFHPFMRGKDVILKVDEKVWNKFTEYQKGLWLVDETEERWKQLIKKYPKIRHKEVYFESEKGLSNNTFDRVIDLAADIVGLKRHKVVKVVNRHATGTKTSKEIQDNKKKREKLQIEDQAYMRKINYNPDWSDLPPTYNSYELPPDDE